MEQNQAETRPNSLSLTTGETNEKDNDGQSAAAHSAPAVSTSSSCLPCECRHSVFWRNKFNLFRLLMLMVIIMLLVISLLYTYGQLYSLTLADYFCAPKTMEEILEHSRENNLSGGTLKGCWTTSSYQLDEVKIFQSYRNSLASYDTQPVQLTAMPIFKATIFSLNALFLFFALLRFLYLLSIDCLRFYKATWEKNKDDKCWKSLPCIASIMKWHKKWDRLYTSRFGVDKPQWVLLSMFRELTEIVIQSIALFQYGGAQSAFLYAFHPDDKLTLAENAASVIMFAVFVTLNCVCTGLLWFCYLFKHDVFSGKFMRYLLSANDTIFDIFYAIYPLLIVGNDSDFKKAAASIGENPSFLLFLSSSVAMSYLSWKTYKMTSFLSRSAREEWATAAKQQPRERISPIAIRGSNAQSGISELQLSTLSVPKAKILSNGVGATNQQSVPEKEATDGAVTQMAMMKRQTGRSSKCSLLCYGDQYLEAPAPDDAANNIKSNILKTRKAFLFCWSASLCLFGVCLITFVSVHFHGAQNICTNYSDYDTHPEMKLWQYCNFKVYPFFPRPNELPCNCRAFAMKQEDVIVHKEYLSQLHSDTVSSLFNRFYMMEAVMIQCPDWSECSSSYDLEFNSFQLKSLNMRAVYIDGIHSFNITAQNAERVADAWTNIEVLHIHSRPTSKWPLTASHLSRWNKLQYVYFEGGSISSVDFACNMPSLKVLKVRLNQVTMLPSCIAYDLPSLEILDLTANVINSTDTAVFMKQSLKRLVLSMAQVGVHSFGNESFGWRTDNEIEYQLYSTSACLLYEGQGYIPEEDLLRIYGPEYLANFDPLKNKWSYGDNAKYYYPFVHAFLANTSACNSVCEIFNHSSTFGGRLFTLNCDPQNVGDGICNELCDDRLCQFDGFDCMQLCECDRELLSNEQCDPQCNTTACDYDTGDCLYHGNYTMCANYTGCLVEVGWIGDGLCDEYCRHHEWCDYDKDDCECPVTGLCARMWDAWVRVCTAISVDFYADELEFCTVYPLWIQLHPEAQPYLEPFNCTQFFRFADSDGNELVTLHEVIYVYQLLKDQPQLTNYSDFDPGLVTHGAYKALQMNCSACAPSLEAYYGANYDQIIKKVQGLFTD